MRFVWIMGADNLRSFHRWQNWRGIAALVPIAVVDRLGPSLYATAGTRRPGAGALSAFRRRRRRSLPDRKPPAWVYLHGLKSPLSSTALRALRAKAMQTPQMACGTAEVETVNRRMPILVWCPGFDVRGAEGSERKGTPVHTCSSLGPAPSRARTGLQGAS